MKLFIIQYAKPVLYIIVLPAFFMVTLIALAVVVLTEKIFSHKKATLPAHYYKLTSWECEQEYANG